MHPAIICDEISQDISHVMHALELTSLDALELRMIGERNILYLSDGELKSLKKLLDKSGIKVCGIASPIFKAPLSEEDRPGQGEKTEGLDPFKLSVNTFAGHLELLEKAISIAKLFDTRIIRCFSFMGDSPFDNVVDVIAERLSCAAKRAEEEDIVLCVENEPSCYVQTSDHLKELLDRVQSRNVAALWDPGNAYCVGEKNLLQGFHKIKDRVMHIHLKDVPETVGDSIVFTVVGNGILDYPRQIKEWRKAEYTGYLSLEPHLAIGRGSAPGAIDSIRNLQEMLR
ncbi:MAG TPA: sugar phosphate isomerase/epimerase [Bacillota bacterium]|nr:sugar phosphate isomerase/epimerase [Bacillota bacterium]